MATADPFDGQPPPLQNPIPADGFVPIARTAWFKSAGRREERRNEPLINPNKCQRQVLHCLLSFGCFAGFVIAVQRFAQTCPAQEMLNGLDDLSIGSAHYRRASDKKHIPTLGNRNTTQTNRFAHTPPDTITYHCLADASAGGEAEAAVCQIIREGTQNHQMISPRFALSPGSLEVSTQS